MSSIRLRIYWIGHATALSGRRMARHRRASRLIPRQAKLFIERQADSLSAHVRYTVSYVAFQRAHDVEAIGGWKAHDQPLSCWRVFVGVGVPRGL